MEEAAEEFVALVATLQRRETGFNQSMWLRLVCIAAGFGQQSDVNRWSRCGGWSRSLAQFVHADKDRSLVELVLDPHILSTKAKHKKKGR